MGLENVRAGVDYFDAPSSATTSSSINGVQGPGRPARRSLAQLRDTTMPRRPSAASRLIVSGSRNSFWLAPTVVGGDMPQPAETVGAFTTSANAAPSLNRSIVTGILIVSPRRAVIVRAVVLSRQSCRGATTTRAIGLRRNSMPSLWL